MEQSRQIDWLKKLCRGLILTSIVDFISHKSIHNKKLFTALVKPNHYILHQHSCIRFYKLWINQDNLILFHINERNTFPQKSIFSKSTIPSSFAPHYACEFNSDAIQFFFFFFFVSRRTHFTLCSNDLENDTSENSRSKAK